MSNARHIPKWILATFIVLWVLSAISYLGFLMSGAGSILAGFLPLTLLAAVIMTCIVVTLAIHNLAARNPKQDNFTYSPIAKTVSLLVIAAIVIGFYATIRSLWFNPTDSDYGTRFIYENIATGVWFGGLVLTTILSAIQKDLYWVSRKQNVTLDERQVQERREVFETSYKIGFFVIFFSSIGLMYTTSSFTTIIANNNGSVPGHIMWTAYYFVLLFFAIPLLVAAWKKS